MKDADLIQLAAQAARGRRPEFTGDPMVERLFGITLALTAELAVTRERLDTLERVLSSHDRLDRDDIEGFRPCTDEVAERNSLQQEYLARVFRVLLQDESPAPAAVAPEQSVPALVDAGGRRVA